MEKVTTWKDRCLVDCESLFLFCLVQGEPSANDVHKVCNYCADICDYSRSAVRRRSLIFILELCRRGSC